MQISGQHHAQAVLKGDLPMRNVFALGKGLVPSGLVRRATIDWGREGHGRTVVPAIAFRD
jgi:hypothetical protein